MPRPAPAAPAAGPGVNPMPTAPLLPLLVKLALLTVLVMVMVTLLGVAETYFVRVPGTEAIAAASLVVAVIPLMTMVANGGIGGGRVLGHRSRAGRRPHRRGREPGRLVRPRPL